MKTNLMLRPRPPALQVNFGKAVFSKEFWKMSKDSSRLVVQGCGFSHLEHSGSWFASAILQGISCLVYMRELPQWNMQPAGYLTTTCSFCSFLIRCCQKSHITVCSWAGRSKMQGVWKHLVVHCAHYIISCLVCKKCEKLFKSKSCFSMILHRMIFLTRPCLFIQASDWC